MKYNDISWKYEFVKMKQCKHRVFEMFHPVWWEGNRGRYADNDNDNDHDDDDDDDDDDMGILWL